MQVRSPNTTPVMVAARQAAVAVPALLVLTVGWCTLALGQSGTVHQTAGYGLSMAVDTAWVDGFGYRPVRITVAPTATTSAERTLAVEFLVRRRWTRGDEFDLRVAEEIEIPAGSGPADAVQTTLAVPQNIPWDSYSINVLEDGKLLKWLCTPWTQISSMSVDFGEALPVLLVVGDRLPETRQLAAPLNVQPYRRPPIRSSFVRGIDELPTAASCTVQQLPQRWIDYSNLDILCLSLEDLGQLKRERRTTHRAILEWTAAGGNLWVYGIEPKNQSARQIDENKDWRRIGELEQLLGLPRATGDISDPALRGWNEPNVGLYGRPVQGVSSVSYRESSPRRYEKRSSVRPHFLLREYGLGLIVAFAEDPFPSDKRGGNRGSEPAQWQWVFNTMGPDRWVWFKRHGVSMLRENEDYWDFLIPGVGLAPVTEFCVLITLFVLGIGPLNYWLLRRSGRLHLLVVTIPVSAATVTFLLFAYAIIADGLSTRVRARSVTCVDQGRGQAVCWARLSYYAGLAPGRGLTFPEDVVVMPLEASPMHDYYPRQPPLRREVIWGDDQWLASGWLSARTPTQYLTVRSRASDLGLDLIRPDGGSGKLRVKNRLGTRIKQLLVRSADGEHYWTTEVEADATAALEPVKPQIALRRLARPPRLMPPEAMEQRYYGVFGVSPRRYYWGWGNAESSIDPPQQETSRLEKTLATMVRSTGGNTPLVEPGSYVAVVDRSPEVELGIRSPRQEASYHVVLGRW